MAGQEPNPCTLLQGDGPLLPTLEPPAHSEGEDGLWGQPCVLLGPLQWGGEDFVVTNGRPRQVGTREAAILAEDGHDHPAAGVAPPGPGEEALQGQCSDLGCPARHGGNPAPAPPPWPFPGMAIAVGDAPQTLCEAGATGITTSA